MNADYMASRKQNDALTIHEIEYSIQIKDKDKEFHELFEILRSELTRFEDTQEKNDKTANPIRDFLKTNIDRSIVIRDATRVYFLDYREQGSLTIHFKLLVITRYMNYGTTRQALEFLVKDTIGDYFEELLERHLPVSISVHSADSELYDIPAVYQETEDVKVKYLPVVLASLALLFTLTMGLLWFLQNNQVSIIKKPADDYREKYYELLIDKQVNEAIMKEKLNFNLHKNKVSDSDSGQNVKVEGKK